LFYQGTAGCIHSAVVKVFADIALFQPTLNFMHPTVRKLCSSDAATASTLALASFERYVARAWSSRACDEYRALISCIGRIYVDVREAVYERGLADLRAITHLLGDGPFLFGAKPSSADAGLYGFIASIYFYEIDTPLRRYVLAQENLVNHRAAMRNRMLKAPGG
jgi:glutathione S-transferase